MQVYNYSYQETLDLINNKKILDYGSYGNIIPWNDQLIKIDRIIYNCLINNLKNEKIIENSIDEYFRFNKINANQIEYLANKQKKVFLTKLPRGIIYMNNRPIAIILYYHQNYKRLDQLNIYNEKEIWQILSNVLLAIKELEDNDIYQFDLHSGNILYNSIKPELIDLDGNYIDYGTRRISSRNRMYNDYASIFKELLRKSDNQLYNDKFVKRITEINSYDDASEYVKTLKKMI